MDRDAPTDAILAGHFFEDDGYHVTRTRGASSWLIIATLDGRGRVAGGGEGRGATPGVLALFRPHHRHVYEAVGPWEFAWAHFAPPAHLTPALDWSEVETGLAVATLDVEELAAARPALLAMAAEGAAGAPIALALLESVLWRGLRAAEGGGRGDVRVRRGIRSLLRDLREPFSSASLGRAMDLSPSRAAHLFAESIGEPPRRFLERHRLERARALLRATSRPVKLVARDVGFESEFYFSRRYRSLYGQPPSAERIP